MRRLDRAKALAALLLAAAACTSQPGSPAKSPLQDVAPPGSSGEAAQPEAGAAVLAGSWVQGEHAFVLQGRSLATGDPSSSFPPLPLQLSGHTAGEYAYDSGRTRLALVTGTSPLCTRMSGGSACWPSAESLHLIDLDDHSAVSIDLRGSGTAPALAFRPDGKRVALARQTSGGMEVLVYSFHDEGRTVQAVPFLPSLIDYSSDGEELVVIGSAPGKDPGILQPGPMTVAVLDGESLEVVWEQTLDVLHGSWCLEGCGQSHEQVLFAYWAPALVRLPGSDRLVIVHADANKMTTIDFGGRSVVTHEIAASEGWIDRLMALATLPAEAKGGSLGAVRSAVASPDGSRVYAVGRTFHASRNPEGLWDGWDEPMGLIVFDPTTGRLLDSGPAEADRVGLSADGRHLLLSAWAGSEVRTESLDPVTLEPKAALEAWDFLSGRAVDGSALILGVSYASAAPRYAYVDPLSMTRGDPWSAGGPLFLFP